MELAAVIVNVGILIATAGAAAVAWWKAIESSQDRKAAEEARDRAVEAQVSAAGSLSRSADAAEDIARHTREPAWSMPRRGTGDRWSMQNASRRNIYVDRVEVEPENATPLVDFVTPVPASFGNGDTLELNAHPRMSLSAQKVVVVWRFEDEPDAELFRSPRWLSETRP